MTFDFLDEELVTEDRSSPNKVTKTYNVTASPDLLRKLEKFLAYVQWCALTDHTANVVFHIDGPDSTLFVHGLKLWTKNRLHPRPDRTETP